MKRLVCWMAGALIGVSAATEAAEGHLRVAFVGDVMMAASEATGRLVAGGGDPLAAVARMLADADFRVANFESSAGVSGQADPFKPYSFRTSELALQRFASIFELAGVANNHAGDFGRAAYQETLEGLIRAGSQPFGGGRNPPEAHRAVMVERGGVKLALLGYLDIFPRWFAVAPGMPGAAWLDEDQARLDIARARAAGADVVVVVPHWGTEYAPRANQRQRRIARTLLDAGADAIIGGHPHVVQDYELYKGKPIVYSLGNFVFDGFEDEDTLTGWAVFVDFDRKGVVALTTRSVHIDPKGSPEPLIGGNGPCWQRGRVAMTTCP